MCQFCLKHGEGEKWYLQAQNYSEDMLSDLKRLKFMELFADPQAREREFQNMNIGLDRMKKMPWLIRTLFSRIITRKMKKVHFGQVVPLEDVERIFEFTNSIVRVACVCRESTLGKEKRYCYGISLGPNGGKLMEIFQALEEKFTGGVDDARFEMLTKEEALAAFRAHEREGLCHTVWTFQTPFIGGICNCDRSDCHAMRSTITHQIPVMFRAEYIAAIDPEACKGCRQCMRLCQFGALSYSAATKKTLVDQTFCYGCGICRSVCSTNAIRLEDRAASPAANLW
ncbi:4Fe-4S binding protein [Geotalea sp. SG265]|uniref:4Fe-4S binding protein n=1 Tax=Geotalea sp. SG265 TaxID=2922867 RepID=UPI001FB01E87|nr:4Fe-4S binding protein [Geotalea sp. SG265]